MMRLTLILLLFMVSLGAQAVEAQTMWTAQ